ncbi:type II toxin-antitoxin system HicB family antitoxin [Salinarimonas ramus]|uniref:Antitoxin n=1 Tax=Salinarimonas ramus TaxID=690164 RepID=A0A917QBA3_9HYPH|nr:type II toxin-antitoxin system HicB family antitoxin [Salinarimonas ramus]GGK41471.1 antitoxin [Salinarimonas ramus]
MRTYTYPALIEDGDEHGLVVTFPNVPEAVTQGDDRDDARAMAVEALGLALLTYPKRGLALPPASAGLEGHEPITVDAETAAKLAVLEAFVASGMGKVELAKRLGKDEKEVRRILDPMHPTKLPTLEAALNALGRRLVVGIVDV